MFTFLFKVYVYPSFDRFAACFGCTLHRGIIAMLADASHDFERTTIARSIAHRLRGCFPIY